MSKPSKHVVLRYRDPDSTAGGSETSNSVGSQSPASRSSSMSDLNAVVDLGPAQQYLDLLNSFRLDQDDEWKQTADKISSILQEMRAKWIKLEQSRKKLYADSQGAAAQHEQQHLRVVKKRSTARNATSPRKKRQIMGV